MGPSKKCWVWCNDPSTKAPQIPLRHQKTFHFALFLSNLAILKGVVSCARLRKAAHWPNKNANPLGLSEEKVYCVEKRDMCEP